jgi:citrate synthase
MEPTIHRGLAGVYVDTSHICHIDGERGELVYRGYDISELTDASYEEVVHLLWRGELPTRAELTEFRRDLAPLFALPDGVIEALRGLPPHTDPMHALRTAVSLLAAYDEDPDGVEDANVRRIGASLLVRVPALVATFERCAAIFRR